MGALRRFIIPILLFIFERGLDMSGWENIWIASAIWAVGGVWGLWALVTWQPARAMYHKATQLRITFPEPQSAPIPQMVDSADKGLFDFQAESLEAMTNIGKFYVQLTKDTAKFGSRLTKYANRVVKTNSIGRKLKLSKKLAKDTKRYADAMAIHGSDLQQNGTVLSE
ncbi:MAG: hypothetical protein IH962_04475, partial [Chloroflexi bacterium]|nr:hypothetical protein [Chloroflexota bacterium]